MERCDLPIDLNTEKTERLTEIYMLNQWKFCYLKWTLKKMDEFCVMVDPTLFFVKDNSDVPLDYLNHLTDCFKLFLSF